ncbi:hypothetical protein BVC80_1811g6 [Macleaya cordata]|uniref:Uncharacterized protein n=1 Tax=Macleaya cordata TaxID=56857 RepID=A0A200QVP9_MACCD|nr:hypothetical protein BVC80_1811g6 [Macleaya cordata]
MAEILLLYLFRFSTTDPERRRKIWDYMQVFKRFRLPTDELKRRSSNVGTRVAVRFGNLIDDDDKDDEDLFRMGDTLRHIVRRHRLVFSMKSTTAIDSSSSPMQMAQIETSSTGPANSGETFSSKPVEGGSKIGGGGAGGVRVSGGRKVG